MKKKKQKPPEGQRQVTFWMPEELYLEVKQKVKNTGVSLRWLLIKGAESQVKYGQ